MRLYLYVVGDSSMSLLSKNSINGFDVWCLSVYSFCVLCVCVFRVYHVCVSCVCIVCVCVSVCVVSVYRVCVSVSSVYAWPLSLISSTCT